MGTVERDCNIYCIFLLLWNTHICVTFMLEYNISSTIYISNRNALHRLEDFDFSNKDVEVATSRTRLLLLTLYILIILYICSHTCRVHTATRLLDGDNNQGATHSTILIQVTCQNANTVLHIRMLW